MGIYDRVHEFSWLGYVLLLLVPGGFLLILAILALSKLYKVLNLKNKE
jgi:hypothetical protein